ncbi:hypothetical protein KUTeg_005429 [Tegillarca granosa]|uniref:Prominin-1-A n=1 Tax=Tegillarca granosa TaxID=220873 RepID=A0ABQ9FJR9_TEGGR|nr:hypothetical protein KUTeg_005429 [Tegillarca granosa]
MIMNYVYSTDLIKQLLNGEFDISAQYMELVNFAMGFGICFVIGLLFVIFLPLCGCCVCCCRCCCGNCGGDLKAIYDENEGCKRMGFAQALFLIAVCLLASAGCVYVTNDRFTKALIFADGSSADNLDDIGAYLNNTVAEFRFIAVDMYSIVSSAIVRDIGDLSSIIMNAIFSVLDITSVINSVIALDSNQTIIDINALKSAANTLSSALNTLSSDITSTQSGCSSDCSPSGPCSSFDASAITMNVDFNTLPDLTSVQSSVDAVVAQNLTGVALAAQSALNGIEGTVNASVNSVKTSVDTTMNNFKTVINNMVNTLSTTLTGAIDTTTLKTEIGNFFTTAKDYDIYRQYFGYGLMGLFSLLPFMLMVGIMCGCFCLGKDTRPTERSCLSNCGGCLLLLAPAIMFLLGGLLMLLTTISFMIGGFLELICQTLIDLSIFSQLIDANGIPGFSMGAILLGNASVNLSLYNIFLGCRANQAPFQLFKLDTLLPIDNYLNYTQYVADINTQMDTMSTSIDLSMFKLSTSIITIDLNTIIATMQGIKTQCSGTTKSEWIAHITTTEDIRDNKLPAVESAKTTLQTSVWALEASISGVTAQIDTVKATATAADNQIQNNVTSVLSEAGKSFVSQIIGYVDSYAARVRHLIYNDLAACLPVWNLYDSFTTMLCSYTVDALNGFWFAMGWALFFFIPSIIISIKLSKYYRKMNEEEGYDYLYMIMIVLFIISCSDVDPDDEDPEDYNVRFNMMKRFNKVSPDYND